MIWQEIEHILDRVLELDEPDRISYVEENVHDEELKTEVIRLLKAETHFPEWIEGGIDRLFQEGGSDTRNDFREMSSFSKDHIFKIDRYRIVKEIGRGGMSVVYRAERTDGEFDQEVALKIIQPFGPDREHRFRRLRAERQILASLKHPNIARIFDGGVTAEGWPYMVMELVEGVPVTRHCREKSLGLNDRLKLFLKICRTVAHAHRKLVVHRDLKPGNILVTDDGEVKLLDFGIARMLEDETSKVPLTRTGLPVLTPEYAAPEQFRKRSVTTSVDIYSLGVLLYELLAGVRPFDLSGKSLSLAGVERIICEEQVTKPSGKAGISTIPPEKLKGDLDLICIKALSKEPDERYGSVQEFVEDVHRWLTGLTVSARPATAGYRIRKFVQRNRTGVAAASAIVILLCSFIMVLMHQRGATLQERDRAVSEALKAEQVTGFLLEVFEEAHPDQALGRTVTSRDILDLGLDRAQKYFTDNPEVRARILVSLAFMYFIMDEYDVALPLLEENMAVAAKYRDIDTQARAMRILGNINSRMGNHHESLEFFIQSEQLLKENGQAPGLRHADVLRHLAPSLFKAGKADEALELTEDALRVARTTPGLPVQALVDYLTAYGIQLMDLGRYDESEETLREILGVELPPESEREIHFATQQLLASLAMRRGDANSALSQYRALLELSEDLFPELHSIRSTLLDRIAGVLFRLGRLDETERVLQQKIGFQKARNPDTRTFYYAQSYEFLAVLNMKTGRLDDSIHHFETGRRIIRELYGQENLHDIRFTSEIGNVLRQQGNLKESEEVLNDALNRAKTFPDVDLNHGGRPYLNLAYLYMDQNRQEEALALLDEALEIYKQSGNPYRGFPQEVLETRVRVLESMGNIEEARAAYEQAISLGDQIVTYRGIEWPKLLAGYARFLTEHNYPEAPSARADALAAHVDIYGSDHPAPQHMEYVAGIANQMQ